MGKNIFSLKSRSTRSGLTVFQFILRQSKEFFQKIVDSAYFEVSIAILIVISLGLIFTEFFLPPGPQLNRVIFASDILLSNARIANA